MPLPFPEERRQNKNNDALNHRKEIEPALKSDCNATEPEADELPNNIPKKPHKLGHWRDVLLWSRSFIPYAMEIIPTNFVRRSLQAAIAFAKPRLRTAGCRGMMRYGIQFLDGE
jgi:hypothetical protein